MLIVYFAVSELMHQIFSNNSAETPFVFSACVALADTYINSLSARNNPQSSSSGLKSGSCGFEVVVLPNADENFDRKFVHLAYHRSLLDPKQN